MKHALTFAAFVALCRCVSAMPTDMVGQPTDADEANQQRAAVLQQHIAHTSHHLSVMQQQLHHVQTPGAFEWSDGSTRRVPGDAFVATQIHGYNGYVCQARYVAGNDVNLNYPPNFEAVLDPGVLTPDGCLISYAGRSHLIRHYKMLTAGSGGTWAPIKPGQTGDAWAGQAVVGGREGQNDVYICRVPIDDPYHDQYLVGKAVGQTCFVPVGPAEINWPTQDYQILLKGEAASPAQSPEANPEASPLAQPQAILPH